jgi:hypothetical protein
VRPYSCCGRGPQQTSGAAGQSARQITVYITAQRRTDDVQVLISLFSLCYRSIPAHPYHAAGARLSKQAALQVYRCLRRQPYGSAQQNSNEATTKEASSNTAPPLHMHVSIGCLRKQNA